MRPNTKTRVRGGPDGHLAFTRGVDFTIAEQYMMVVSSMWVQTNEHFLAIQATKDAGGTWVYGASWKGFVLQGLGHSTDLGEGPNNGADYAVLASSLNQRVDSGASGIIHINISNRVHGNAQFSSRNGSSSYYSQWAGFESIAFSKPSNLCNGFRLFSPGGALYSDLTVGGGEVWLYRLRK
jgi:hypothetical protein